MHLPSEASAILSDALPAPQQPPPIIAAGGETLHLACWRATTRLVARGLVEPALRAPKGSLDARRRSRRIPTPTNHCSPTRPRP